MLIKASSPLLGSMKEIGEQDGVGGVVDERLRRRMEIVINMETLVQAFNIYQEYLRTHIFASSLFRRIAVTGFIKEPLPLRRGI
jgi:hypothetical protein